MEIEYIPHILDLRTKKNNLAEYIGVSLIVLMAAFIIVYLLPLMVSQPQCSFDYHTKVTTCQ